MEKNRRRLVESRFRGNDGLHGELRPRPFASTDRRTRESGNSDSTGIASEVEIPVRAGIPVSVAGGISWNVAVALFRRTRESGNIGSACTVSGVGMPVIVTGGNLRNVILALVIVIAGGCGYQLRGAVSLPPDLDAVHVAGPPDIGAALTQVLDSGGIQVQSTRDSTKAELKLSGEKFSRRVLSVNPDTGKESEFELAYQVTFQVTGEGDVELVPRQTVSLVRDYVFDPDAVLGKSREQNVLRAEMRRDAAGQILRRIETALGR